MPHSSLHQALIDENDQALQFGALGKDRVAAITGAASGIGHASAQAMAKLGMKLALCDVNADLLQSVGETFKKELGEANVLTMQVDVSKVEEMEAFRDLVLDTFGEINVLMLNAAIGSPPAKTFDKSLSAWRTVLEINLFGVINGTQIFVPYMVNQENPSVVIVSGSKQGITCPPGNAAYNVSKAAVKTLTEQLAHELREANSLCTAHLFVPGWTYTAMNGAVEGGLKPEGAWTAEQTVSYMLEKLDAGHFYIVCPDDQVTEELDRLRMAWSASDPVLGRPALSRWHPEWKASFDEYISQGLQAGRSRSPSRVRGRRLELAPGNGVREGSSRGVRTPAES